MTKKTLPLYVINFRLAYENLYESYLKKDFFALIDKNGTETPEFLNYALTVRTFVKKYIRSLIKSHNSDGYFDFEDILDDMVSVILELEFTKQYFLKKGDAKWAFRSMKLVIHNEFCDRIKKDSKKIPLPIAEDEYKKMVQTNSMDEDASKKPYYKMVSFDSIIMDDDGGETTLGSLTADPYQDTEYTALLAETVKYATSTFIHEIIYSLIEEKKPHYLIAYLNCISERSGSILSNDILTLGFDATLKIIIFRLKDLNIDVDYLNDIHFEWEKYMKQIQNSDRVVDNWRYESHKRARKISLRKGLIAS